MLKADENEWYAGTVTKVGRSKAYADLDDGSDADFLLEDVNDVVVVPSLKKTRRPLSNEEVEKFKTIPEAPKEPKKPKVSGKPKDGGYSQLADYLLTNRAPKRVDLEGALVRMDDLGNSKAHRGANASLKALLGHIADMKGEAKLAYKIALSELINLIPIED